MPSAAFALEGAYKNAEISALRGNPWRTLGKNILYQKSQPFSSTVRQSHLLSQILYIVFLMGNIRESLGTIEVTALQEGCAGFCNVDVIDLLYLTPVRTPKTLHNGIFEAVLCNVSRLVRTVEHIQDNGLQVYAEKVR
jgi:hypothetical protein